MKLDIILAVLVAVLAFYTSLGNDGAWYKDAMRVEVVPLYVDAYSTFQRRIIAPFLATDIDQLNNETVGSNLATALVRQINCGVRTMRASLTDAMKNSETIGKKLHDEVAALVLTISATEADIGNTQRAVAVLETQVSQTEGQMRTAEHAVADKEESVRRASNDLAEAQKSVEKARECRGKRSFRLRRVVRVIVRPICSVINYGGINRAKDRRSLADRELNDARNRLTTYQQHLNVLRGILSGSRTQLSNSNDRLQSLSRQLNQLREQQKVIASTNEDLRGIVLKISTVFASTTVLQEIVEKLIDFEALISPLNAVYNAMNSNGLIKGSLATSISSLITAEVAVKVRANLDHVQKKLLSMPLNVDPTQAC